MNTISKRENGHQPANFGSAIDQIFQQNLNRFFDDSFWGFDGAVGRHQVPVNILETDKNYELELVAPGLKKQDFKLDLQGETLTVSFDHREEQQGGNGEENKRGGWLRKEYKRNAFSRSFSLNDTIDTGKISARYEDGVLYLTFPKKENAQKVTRTINVQ
jgi:HSP20 family protein